MPVLCSAQRTTAAPINKARAGSESGLHLDGFDMRHARTLVDRTKQQRRRDHTRQLLRASVGDPSSASANGR
jgi:hypothetical protein